MNATLREKLDALAGQLADNAISSDDEAFKLDTFKVLSGFWINDAKLGMKEPEDDSRAGFAAMRERIAKADQGGEK